MDGGKLQAYRAELGREIRTRREAQGISTRKFSAMVGISKTSLINIEKGAANPSIEILTRIADGLGARVSDLISF